MADNLVSADMAVGIHFTLTLASGEVVDSSVDGDPLHYLHGHANIVPGLEKELDGKAVGDELKVEVEPALGFGERVDPIEIPRADFPDDAEVSEGLQLQLESDDGEIVPGTILSATDEKVMVDINHPFAGQTLHFNVKILDIRPATAEELEHGHVHGADGHDHNHGHDDDA